MIINNIFIFGFLFLIGLLLFSMITWLEYNLPENFILSTNFWVCLRILLVISTIFMILPISFLMCYKSCSNNLISIPLITKNTNIIYYITLFITGVIMISCGTIIKSEIETDINDPAWGIIGMGISLSLLSICLIAWKFYKDNKDSSNKSKRQEADRIEAVRLRQQELLNQEIIEAEAKAKEAEGRLQRIRKEEIETKAKETEERQEREKRERESAISRKKIQDAEAASRRAEAEAEAQKRILEASRIKYRKTGKEIIDMQELANQEMDRQQRILEVNRQRSLKGMVPLQHSDQVYIPFVPMKYNPQEDMREAKILRDYLKQI